MSRCTDVQVHYTKSGLPRYFVEVFHDGLNKYQVARGDEPGVAMRKAESVMAQWDEMWDKKQQRDAIEKEKTAKLEDRDAARSHALDRTRQAQKALDDLNNILAFTLSIDDTINWESLKNRKEYGIPQPTKAETDPPTPPIIPEEPKREDECYQVHAGLLGMIFPSIRAAKERDADSYFQRHYARWQSDRDTALSAYEAQMNEHARRLEVQDAKYTTALAAWYRDKTEYLEQRDAANAAVDEKEKRYLEGEPSAIQDYCEMVVSNSHYPDYFPQSYETEYNGESKVLIVDYQLPPKEKLPTLKEVKYTASKDMLDKKHLSESDLKRVFEEKHLSEAEINRIFDSVLYQIALRTVHELFEADRVNGLALVAFNGYVRSTNRATGKEHNVCVLSLQVTKQEFVDINLAAVDPKACFKTLKGVGSSKLYTMTAVAPLLQMSREDKRFVAGRAVVDGLREGYNLATMDWEDFEHLVREVFEREFSREGGEVKITRASRDGGIDAVVFDPDPIHGGKIVIQAKRYTNTVSVSAVRDLYGAVLNEGASKGILVTTSDYGPDAYEFAKDKPLVLLAGGNLLHLMEKHGHKARIDLKEAKALASEEAREGA